MGVWHWSWWARRARPAAFGWLLFAVLLVAGAVAPGAALATNVSGTISTNTTWTTSGSPYVLTGNVSISSGVTLTINSGVVVKFNASSRIMTVST